MSLFTSPGVLSRTYLDVEVARRADPTASGSGRAELLADLLDERLRALPVGGLMLDDLELQLALRRARDVAGGLHLVRELDALERRGPLRRLHAPRLVRLPVVGRL